jgi:chromosome segregation ATPase
MFIMVFVVAFLVACGGSEEQANQQPAAEKPSAEEHAVTSQDVKEEVAEAARTTTDYAEAKKEEYQKDIEAKLDKYQQEIYKIAVGSRAMAYDAKVAVDERLQVLIDKKEAAQKKLAELQSASRKAWEDLEAGMDAAMVELESAFEEASSHFESSKKEVEDSQSRGDSPG